MRLNTFPKAEHLCLRNDIEKLFTAGSKSVVVYPMRVVYRVVDHREGPKVKVLLSVAKRKSRHAVDRNRAKRQLREAYRKNKHSLVATLPKGVGLHVGIIWLCDAPIDTAVIEKKLCILLHRVQENLQTADFTTTVE